MKRFFFNGCLDMNNKNVFCIFFFEKKLSFIKVFKNIFDFWNSILNYNKNMNEISINDKNNFEFYDRYRNFL